MRAALERGGDCAPIESGDAASKVGEARKDLREDDAGVAARAHQRALRGGLRDRRADAAAACAHASQAARIVRDMLVPVSPSGTGKTLIALKASRWMIEGASQPADERAGERGAVDASVRSRLQT